MITCSKPIAIRQMNANRTECVKLTVNDWVEYWVRDTDQAKEDWVASLTEYVAEQVREGLDLNIMFMAFAEGV